MANHRNGGRDPIELELTVQPANTARPVEATPAVIVTPSRLWAAKPTCFESLLNRFRIGITARKLGGVEAITSCDLRPSGRRKRCAFVEAGIFLWLQR